MSTSIAELQVPTPDRKRWTREDCRFLERTGLLTERYELIDGDIIVKMGQKRPHAIGVVQVNTWLVGLFGGEFVQCQLPVEVRPEDRSGNDPEPDASVLVRPAREYFTTTPGPEDIRLIVEVADTTLASDLRAKASLYARNSIAEYFVLDVTGRRLYRHRQPTENGYEDVTTLAEDAETETLAVPGRSVRVSDLLPPVAVTEEG